MLYISVDESYEDYGTLDTQNTNTIGNDGFYFENVVVFEWI